MGEAKLRKLLIATRNPGKFAEIKSFLKDLPVNVVSLSDLGIKEKVEETGKTYKRNSTKKATFYAQKSGLPTIADDGGIEIDALGGGPGVRSRRFFVARGGRNDATDEEIIEKMTSFIKTLPQKKRSAKFRTIVTFALPSGKFFCAEGVVRGVLKEPYIKQLLGYPYRSFFYLPKIKKYYHESELTDEEVRRYNHRYRAIRKLKPIIKRELGIRNYGRYQIYS